MQPDSAAAKFTAIESAMIAAGAPPLAIANFLHSYRELLAGHTGDIPECTILPLTTLPDAEKLGPEYIELGSNVRSKTVVIKLNGGLGTSMGLNKVKSLIVVKNGLTILDIIARQSLCNSVPLMLMNSFATREDTLAILSRYPRLSAYGLDLDFLQHKVPKINRDDLLPVHYPQAPHLEWCPPGHGDIYAALVTSGILPRLLNAGYRYAFISNADNLGASLDVEILGYLVQHSCPFLLEVADRTAADIKGGHLAIRPDGNLILRESAQCPESDRPDFQDISRHKYFNTNNLWLDLEALRKTMAKRGNILGLPLICNQKHVDPSDASTTPVYQLETALGAAISIIERAQAIRVPRKRFVPIKTTNDLFLVRSDVYALTEDFRLLATQAPPVIELDARYFKSIEAFEQRLPFGIPDLAACGSLTVIGDVKFGKDIRLQGTVTIRNTTGQQILLEHNSTLSGEINL